MLITDCEIVGGDVLTVSVMQVPQYYSITEAKEEMGSTMAG